MTLHFVKAPWCTACHAIEDKIPDWVVVHDLNTTEGKDFAEPLGICSIPVFIAMDGDGEVARIQSNNLKAVIDWYDHIQGES